MPRVSKRSVAWDSLAFSLIEGIQTVGVLARLPSVSTEVAFLFKLFQQVIPLGVGNLEHNGNIAIEISDLV